MLILKEDVAPPISFMRDNNSFWLFSFMILKDWVTDPAVVNTVSNFILSCVMVTLALPLVIKESFLQEVKNKQVMNTAKRELIKSFIFQM